MPVCSNFVVYKNDPNIIITVIENYIFSSRAKNRPIEGEENVEISPMTVTKTTVI